MNNIKFIEAKKLNDIIISLDNLNNLVKSDEFIFKDGSLKDRFIFNDDYSFKSIFSYEVPLRKSPHSNKKLEALNLEELLDTLSGNSYDHNDFKKILFLINKIRFSLWLEKTINKLTKALKALLNTNKKRLENKREFIRKIFSFNFKNLDDTHATVIFN